MKLKRSPSAARTTRWLCLAPALILLASCASDPEVRVVTETRTVTEKVEVYRPLPETLTEPVPYPPALPPAWTNEDLIDLTFALFDALDQANADKRRAGELTRPSEALPEPADAPQ